MNKGVTAFSVFLMGLLIPLLFAPRIKMLSDGKVMWDLAGYMGTEGRLDMPYPRMGYTVKGADGKVYSKYGLGWSIALLPAAIIYRLVEIQGLDRGITEVYERLLVTLTPAVVSGLTVLMIYLSLLELGLTMKRSLTFALSALLSSPLLVYSRDLYSEAFQTMILAMFLYWI